MRRVFYLRSKMTEVQKNTDKTVIDMFTLGISMRIIAKHCNIHINDVPAILRKNGLGLDLEDIIKLYLEDEKTPTEIGKMYGVAASTVVRRLRKAQVDIRSISQAQQKWTVDEDFFKNIDSPSKAYWLGMMYSDGYVCSNLRDFGITLPTKDRNHVEKFARAIKYTGKIEDFSQEGPFGLSYYSRIVPASRVSCLNLISHGCTPKKTFSLVEPVGLPRDLVRHFIRGVVDGEGEIYIYEKASSLELVGTFPLLKWIAGEGPPGLSGAQKHKNIWKTRTGRKSSREWIKWLYHDCEDYLDKKFASATTVIERGF